MDPLLMTYVSLLVLIWIRGEIVVRIRLKAVDEIFRYKDWQEKKELLKNPSFYGMVFDLTKWTFKGFYPELYARRIAREIAEQDE